MLSVRPKRVPFGVKFRHVSYGLSPKTNMWYIHKLLSHRLKQTEGQAMKGTQLTDQDSTTV